MLPSDLQGLRQIFVTLAIHRLCCIILLLEVFFYPHCAKLVKIFCGVVFMIIVYGLKKWLV